VRRRCRPKQRRPAADRRCQPLRYRLWSGLGINKPGPRALRAPFLYVGTKSDWRAPLNEARSIVRHTRSRDKRSLFYRGSLHGWQLVQAAPFAAKTRSLILDWVRDHS
jgi:hypothetical protein